MGLKEMLAKYQAQAYKIIQDEDLISRKNDSDATSSNSSNDYIDTTNDKLNDYQIAVNGNFNIRSRDITSNDPIYARINEIVNSNNLHDFYNEKRIKKLVKKCHTHNYNHIADLFKFPATELAVDLCALALYDIIILADDSGSMIGNRNEDRVLQLKQICKDVAEIATLFDDDGISLRFLNSHYEGDNLTTEKDVTNIINKVSFEGATPLGGSLANKVLKPFLYEKKNLDKPILVIIITDGCPNPEKREVFEEVIYNTCKTYNRKSRIVEFEIAQVGNDLNAQQWLDYLDNHKKIGKYVDVTSDFETEQMQYKRNGLSFSYYIWLLKLMLGGIDDKYDSQDS